MTTRKNNNRKQSNATRVNKAAKTAKQSVHTWNAVTRAFQEPANHKVGRDLLEAMNTLGVHVMRLATLKTPDFFTAWWGGLKDQSGNPQMFKSVGYKVTVCGEEKQLYTLEEGGLYKAVKVYEKRTILSTTDKNFDKREHLAPTTDVVVDGLKQCALCDTWVAKAKKAEKNAQSMTEGYVNNGTAQQPDWCHVALSNNGEWIFTGLEEKPAKKSTKKSLKKAA
jgi:hypothetical protein